MAKTLVQIKQEIEKLQKEAERIRPNEIAGVIDRIRGAIEFYDLKPGDLFGTKRTKIASPRPAPAKKAAKPKKPSVPKYRDKESGKTWTGVGKRPGWFVTAVAAGMDPKEMEI